METRHIPLNEEPPKTVGFLIPSQKPNAEPIELSEFFTIGRDAGNHLILDDSFVSGRHARIERRTHGFFLRDQGSRNGTFLNGSRIVEASLNIMDKIRLGESTFVFSEAPTLLPELTSRNPNWNQQLRRLPALAQTDFPVLLTGPSGAGKEILARALHRFSSRRTGPFVSINCSALSDTLIESELFGHVKGSFTGAANDRKGAFESARGGTLLLDEIGDLPLSLQPKLLRALENREIRPVGSDRVCETDVRIVAATHKNLVHEITLGRFREDLFYRLNVCVVRPPNLVERMEDFEGLLYHFARELRVRFSFNAIERLKKHSWPGNIRELRNLVARAAAYMPGEHIQPEHIEQLLDQPHFAVRPALEDRVRNDAAGFGASGTLGKNIIKEIEREMIVQRLLANQGNQRRTAADLGIPKSTLHDRIHSYKIDVENLLKGIF